MPNHHGKQKRVAKQKKRRELARRRSAEIAAPGNVGALLRQAAASPFGPVFITPEWKVDELPPGLVTIVVTRRLAGGLLLPAVALVDRTCLGVKAAFSARPVSELELGEFVDEIGAAHGGIEPCDVLVAQSVVFHAVDFARRLGFEPHRDFPEMLFGPRPAVLLDTPLCRPARPYYISGPDDDVRRIVQKLERAVGAEGFTFVLGGPEGPGSLDGQPFDGEIIENVELAKGVEG